jgi:hypothetical protein
MRCKDNGKMNFECHHHHAAWLHDKFWADGTVQNVDKECFEDLAV